MHELPPEDWKQVLELLDTALDLEPPERQAWLATLDGSRPAIRSALTELLARHATRETEDFMKALPQFTRVELETAAPELCPGGQVAAYRLIRELGRGGMGAVWLAERIDGKFKRQVALKFPYAGPAQRELVERLSREREILSGLEHPNIARLYDADVTPSGQPFLVLEYVDGIPMNEYCDSRRTPVRDRLELFLQVIQAVQYAHARLVIHRDLKPSNMLIAADGTVHLLDFGIAKLLSSGGVATASPLTEFGGRALTPDYASPEQIANRSLTTSSDIYSLGVVLYELLAGTRPYRLERDDRGSLEAAIAEADVVAPSRATGDAALARHLKGDLDNIILKALKKDPEERYATAQDLGEDLRRHLAGLPVHARPATLAYRARKFITRYRWPVTAGALGTLALVGALVFAVHAMLLARRERDLAASRLADVRHLANVFLFDVDAKISDISGTTEARQLLVTTGLSYLDRMAADAGDDVSLLREIARGYDKLGDVQGSVIVSNLGNTDAAMASYLKASALRRHPAIARSTDPEVLREAARGEQKLATGLFSVGKMTEAREHMANCVALLERAVATIPPEARMELLRERAEALIGHGFSIAVDGDLTTGLQTLRDAVNFYERLPPATLDDPRFGRGYAFALFRTIQVLSELPGNEGLSEALDLAQKVVAIDRKMLAAAPQRADLHRGLARDLAKIVTLFAQAGRHEEALAACAEARRMYEEELAADRRDKLPRRNLDIVLVHEAESLLALGRIEAARPGIEQAVEDLVVLLEEDPGNVLIQMNFAQAAIVYQRVIVAQARNRAGSLNTQLKRAIHLLDKAQAFIEPLRPKLVGSEAEVPARIVTARQEAVDLLADSAGSRKL